MDAVVNEVTKHARVLSARVELLFKSLAHAQTVIALASSKPIETLVVGGDPHELVFTWFPSTPRIIMRYHCDSSIIIRCTHVWSEKHPATRSMLLDTPPADVAAVLNEMLAGCERYAAWTALEQRMFNGGPYKKWYDRRKVVDDNRALVTDVVGWLSESQVPTAASIEFSEAYPANDSLQYADPDNMSCCTRVAWSNGIAFSVQSSLTSPTTVVFDDGVVLENDQATAKNIYEAVSKRFEV
jgi:hypothetical protein